jgi:HD-GYP domain-containing protein (c-di-GMP phosphodiesterase class II)
MNNIKNKIDDIISRIPIKDFKLILGLKISENLFRTISCFDTGIMDFDTTLENLFFSVEDKFKYNNFDIVLYEESINKYFFENKNDYFAIGQNIIFRNNTVGFVYFLINNNTKYKEIQELKTLLYDHLKKFLEIILDSKDIFLKEYNIEQTINSLFHVLKVHDPYTFHHSLRIADFSILIAEQLKLDQKEIEKLYYASLIHDLGEIWIPKEILQKPDKLTPVEIEIIKQHTKKLEILFAGNDYFSEFVEIAKYHHEYLDGSGYFKKNNNNIPFLSKILSVAEVVDALLSNRPWRKALKIEDAVIILRKMSENYKLDKNIVNIANELIPEYYGGLYTNKFLKYNDIFLILNIKEKSLTIESKVIDSKNEYINAYIHECTIDIDGKIIDIEKNYLNIGNNITIKYYLDNYSFTKNCTVVAKNKLGYLLKINETKNEKNTIYIKWNLSGVGVPLKKVVFVDKFVWRLDNEKAFKINIESISNNNIIFFALKDKINSINGDKIVISFEAFNIKVNLIGEITYKKEIFNGYYHCDFKIGEINDEEYNKLLQIINLRKEQLKTIK